MGKDRPVYVYICSKDLSSDCALITLRLQSKVHTGKKDRMCMGCYPTNVPANQKREERKGKLTTRLRFMCSNISSPRKSGLSRKLGTVAFSLKLQMEA